MGWLDGKSALLVGAGSGIGRATADAFLAEGARVTALELDTAKCAALERDGMRAVRGDATVRADVERALRDTLDAHGGLDTLAVFVGLFDYYRPLRDIPADRLEPAFDEMLHTNVLSSMICTQVALPALAERRGSIALTLSTSAYYPGRGGPLYVASKFALRGLVLALAHELAPEVRVNGVAPGGTLATDLRGLRSLDLHDRALGDGAGRAEELAARTPLAVALDGGDHAGAYVYLSSDHARGVTGEILRSDGGIGARG
jgi:NAD(P)-dependent dehydrogenase (short-subunit alcohol dehydrogenase family)